MLTEAQIVQRLNFVTGSDAAVICGLSPFKTKLQLWMEKTGRCVQEDISGLNHIKFGNFFEDGVAKWFEAESGKPLLTQKSTLEVHKSIPWMAGTFDFLLEKENAILECKTAFSSDGWGDGENTIPPYYLMQVAHYCAVGGFDRAYIAVVFAQKREMRWYQYDRNLELEDKLINREQDFWINNVKADVCPEPVNEKDILTLYKDTNATPMIADSELNLLIEKIKDTAYKIKMLTDIKQELKDKISLFMKDADTLVDFSGKIIATWKYTKPVAYFDGKKLRQDNPELWEKYMVSDDPERRQRRLVVKGDKDERGCEAKSIGN